MIGHRSFIAITIGVVVLSLLVGQDVHTILCKTQTNDKKRHADFQGFWLFGHLLVHVATFHAVQSDIFVKHLHYKTLGLGN